MLVTDEVLIVQLSDLHLNEVVKIKNKTYNFHLAASNNADFSIYENCKYKLEEHHRIKFAGYDANKICFTAFNQRILMLHTPKSGMFTHLTLKTSTPGTRP